MALNIKTFKPEEILVPDSLYSEDVLRAYVSVLRWNSRDDTLPPILVARHDGDPKFIENVSNVSAYFRDKSNSFPTAPAFERAEWIGNQIAASPYLLLDGHHRGVAQALCRQEVHGFEITSDSDLEQVRARVARGTFPQLHRNENTLAEMCNNWLEYVLVTPGKVHTIADLLQEAISNDKTLAKFYRNKE
jgi:hypothetical protein